jgi:hypothetical protein
VRRLPAVVLLLGCGVLLLGFHGFAPDPQAGGKGRPRVARGKGEDERKASAPGKPFRLADDETGALLGKVLPPRQRYGPLADRERPTRRRPALAEFGAPGQELPPSEMSLPRLPVPRSKHVLRPRLVDEETLDGMLYTAPVPQRPSFYSGARIRARSADVNVPPRLPPLGGPVPDRVSLDDATFEASTQAVLAAPQPRRTRPAPYHRLSIPEPYEHRRPLMRRLPAEKVSPVTAGPVTPKR